jgi:glycosyltransferase involved in cell wall biosynthesis
VEEYCRYLSQALAGKGISLELKRILWAEMGWRRALGEFRKSTLEARNTNWFLLQYTALSWSRRGFSIRTPRVIRLLKSMGARCAVVFHDAEAYYGNRLVDRIRRALQNRTMLHAARLADLTIFTIPPDIIRWRPPNTKNTVFIPVGANLPGPEAAWSQTKPRRKDQPTVAVFSLSDRGVRAEEVRDIAEAARHVAERMGKLRVVVLGRNSEVGAEELKERLTGTTVEVAAHGLIAAEQVVQILGSCDVMLFARGILSTRRGSAIAGIACGLPVVGREGWETAAPITEAGVVLVAAGARDEFGPALVRVLTDDAYRESLAERSRRAQEHYFSWSVIAAHYARALRTTALRKGAMDQGTGT